MRPRLEVQSLGSDARRDHRHVAGERLENLEPRPAADPQRHRHQPRSAEERPNIGDVRMKLDAIHRQDARPQPRRRISAHDHEPGPRFLAAHLGKDPAQQNVDRVLVRPPVEGAEKQHGERIARPAHAGEEVVVDAVVDDVDPLGPEPRPEDARVLLADGDDPLAGVDRPALERRHLPGLRPEERPLERPGRGLGGAFPDHRLDVVRDADPRRPGRHHRQIACPLDLPEIERPLRAKPGHGLSKNLALVRRDRVGPALDEVASEPGRKTESRLLRQRRMNQHRLDAVVAQKRLRLRIARLVAGEPTEVDDLVPLGELQHQVQRAQPFARGGRIRDVAVEDENLHAAPPAEFGKATKFGPLSPRRRSQRTHVDRVGGGRGLG